MLTSLLKFVQYLITGNNRVSLDCFHISLCIYFTLAVSLYSSFCPFHFSVVDGVYPLFIHVFL